MEIKSSFIENEIREMTPKDPKALKESYVEFYKAMPSKGNVGYPEFKVRKKAFSAFIAYATDFVSGNIQNDPEDKITLDNLISFLQQDGSSYAKETLSYIQEMKELKQKAKTNPQNEKVKQSCEILKGKLQFFLQHGITSAFRSNGVPFFQEATGFYGYGRPSYVVDINPIINKLLHTDFDFNCYEGQKILLTWLSLGSIPALRVRCEDVFTRVQKEMDLQKAH